MIAASQKLRTGYAREQKSVHFAAHVVVFHSANKIQDMGDSAKLSNPP